MGGDIPESDGAFTLASSPFCHDMVGDTRTPLLYCHGERGPRAHHLTCAVAGPTVSRTLSRRREFAARTAITLCGGGSLKLLTESTVLALGGGVAGIVVAVVGLGIARRFALRRAPVLGRRRSPSILGRRRSPSCLLSPRAWRSGSRLRSRSGA